MLSRRRGRVALPRVTSHPKLVGMAGMIITAQAKEIGEMQAMPRRLSDGLHPLVADIRYRVVVVRSGGSRAWPHP